MIVAHYEIFNPGEPFMHGWPQTRFRTRWLAAIRDRDGDEFLESYVFGRYPDHIETVGFKLFLSHYRRPSYRRALDTLIADPTTTILRLHRRNKLAIYLSFLRARSSGVWSIRDRTGRQPGPLYIDPQDAEAHFLETTNTDACLDEICAGRPSLRIEYEDLVTSWSERMADVQHYVGVPIEPVSPVTLRQRTTPLCDDITNYDQLRSHFSDTEFSTFFEDEDLTSIE